MLIDKCIKRFTKKSILGVTLLSYLQTILLYVITITCYIYYHYLSYVITIMLSLLRYEFKRKTIILNIRNILLKLIKQWRVVLFKKKKLYFKVYLKAML